MTEAEWNVCTDSRDMLVLILDRASERKMRLCALSWARSIFRHVETAPRMLQYKSWLAEAGWSKQFAAAEAFADDKIERVALRAARQESGGPWNLFREACRAKGFSLARVHHCLGYFQSEFNTPSDQEICERTRDILAPFHSAAINSAWLTRVVAALAVTVYDDGAFDRLPILADALEDAGCTNADILNHCRQPGEHVRGCWVVDLLLGKT